MTKPKILWANHPEMIADVMKLWNDGYSANQIAPRYGVSRNSIIGIVSRQDKYGTKTRKPGVWWRKTYVGTVAKLPDFVRSEPVRVAVVAVAPEPKPAPAPEPLPNPILKFAKLHHRSRSPLPQKPATINHYIPHVAQKVVVMPAPHAEPIRPPVPDVGVSIMALDLRSCRNVLGGKDQDTLYCGKPTERKSSWCPACHAKMIQPKMPRRKA